MPDTPAHQFLTYIETMYPMRNGQQLELFPQEWDEPIGNTILELTLNQYCDITLKQSLSCLLTMSATGHYNAELVKEQLIGLCPDELTAAYLSSMFDEALERKQSQGATPFHEQFCIFGVSVITQARERQAQIQAQAETEE